MSRALELFHKTNQFNTTGARYTLEQCHRRFVAGARLYVLQAEDRFTQYGLIGAAWVHQDCIQHLVMSCRALGLGIEDAFLACFAQRLAWEKAPTMFGRLQPTPANLACRQFYSRNGFIQTPGDPLLWSRSLAPLLVVPSHISLAQSGEEDAPALAGAETSGKLDQIGKILSPHGGFTSEQMSNDSFARKQLSLAP
jgi:hypothetical protein